MKKCIGALGLVAIVISLSSCSYYTCATYAKRVPGTIPAEKQELRYL